MGINKKKKELSQKSHRVKDLSIGRAISIPNQKATTIPIKKTVATIGWWKWFWKLLTFFKKGTVNNIAGTTTIKRTPNNLLRTIQNIWKTGKIPFK